MMTYLIFLFTNVILLQHTHTRPIHFSVSLLQNNPLIQIMMKLFSIFGLCATFEHVFAGPMALTTDLAIQPREPNFVCKDFTSSCTPADMSRIGKSISLVSTCYGPLGSVIFKLDLNELVILCRLPTGQTWSITVQATVSLRRQCTGKLEMTLSLKWPYCYWCFRQFIYSQVPRQHWWGTRRRSGWKLWEERQKPVV